MATTPDLTDIQWLTGADAALVLNDLAANPRPLHTAAAHLRKQHSAARAALLLEQLELRVRARTKFSRADQMFFTRVGLQQATDEGTARYKAHRFPHGSRVADLCTGLGGDLIALAAVSNPTGIDSNPAIAALAEANLLAYGCGQTSVRVELADAASLHEFDAWHADPDRRTGGRRTTQLEFHSPNVTTLDAMLQAQPNAAVKLAPAAEAPAQWAADCEQQWLSRRGECRQLCVWSGELTSAPGTRRATRLGEGGEVVGDFTAAATASTRIAGSLGEFLYEPDPSVLAAKLTDDLAASCGQRRVARGVGYLTGDDPTNHPLLSGFRITDTLPLNLKSIAAYLRKRDVGRLEIKHRGVPLEPEKFRKQLKLRGNATATLIAFPHGGASVAAIAERL